MFIQFYEQLNQAEKDLHKKADQVEMVDDDQMMNAAIDVVFKTLRGQLGSLEKEVAGIPRVAPANWPEDYELESRKHLLRFGQTGPAFQQ